MDSLKDLHNLYIFKKAYYVTNGKTSKESYNQSLEIYRENFV